MLLLIDSFPEAVLLANDERRCIDANPVACELFAKQRDELVGAQAAVLDADGWAHLLAHGSVTGETTIERDGRRLALHYRARANVLPGVHLTLLRERELSSHDVLGDLTEIQSEVLASDVRLDRVMERICTRAVALTNAEGATIELQRGDVMVYQVTTGRMAPFLGFELPIAGSLSGLALRTREVLMCEDSEVDPRVDRGACRKVGARSMIVVPLTDATTVVGVLKVSSSRAYAFDTDHVHLLRLIAGFLGSAMAAANANEARRALALRETARLAELERLRKEMTSLLVHDLRSPLTVIMSNLDYIREELPATNEEAVGAALDALDATQRLDRLVAALLETARLEP